MKKTLILLALLVMSTCVVSGCGNKEDEATTGQVEIITEKSTEETTDKPTEKSTEEATDKAAEKSTEEVTEKAAEKSTEEVTGEATEKPTESSATASANAENTQSQQQSESIYTEVSKENVQQEVQQQQSQVQNDTPQNVTGETTIQQGVFAESDMNIVYNNTVVSIDADFSSLKTQLGNPDSTQENPNCGLSDNGKGYVYIYGNMTINTYMKSNKEYVETIFVELNGNAKTGKNIAVGSSSSDVKTMYGSPAVEDDMIMQYNSGDKIMMFYIENSKVTGMFVGR